MSKELNLAISEYSGAKIHNSSILNDSNAWGHLCLFLVVIGVFINFDSGLFSEHDHTYQVIRISFWSPSWNASCVHVPLIEVTLLKLLYVDFYYYFTNKITTGIIIHYHILGGPENELLVSSRVINLLKMSITKSSLDVKKGKYIRNMIKETSLLRQCSVRSWHQYPNP